MKDNPTRIKTEAAVEQVRTLADGGLRVTLDMPESAIMEAAWLMACKTNRAYLQVTFEVEVKKNERAARKKRGSKTKERAEAPGDSGAEAPAVREVLPGRGEGAGVHGGGDEQPA